MACNVVYKGKEYTFAEFGAALHDGLLEDLSKQGILEGISAPEERKVSGIKKGLLSKETIREINERFKLENFTDKEFQELGQRLVDSGEINPEDIVSSIVDGIKTVLEPTEVAALVYYKAKLDKEANDLLVQKIERTKSGEKVESINTRLAEVDSKIFQYQVASYISASGMSSAFRLRQYLRDSNTFDVIREKNKYKAINDGVLPEEVAKRFDQMAEEIKKLESLIKEQEARVHAETENQAVKAIDEDIKEKEKTPKEKRIKNSLDKVAEKIRSKKIHRPDVFSAATPMSVLWDASLEVSAKTLETTGSVVQAINDAWEYISNHETFKGLDKDTQQKAREAFDKEYDVNSFKITQKDGKTKIPNALIRDLVKSGIKDVKKLVKAIQGVAKKDGVEVTEREIRDTITGYGREVSKTKSDLDAEVAQAKRLMTLISKLEDLQSGRGIYKIKKAIKDVSNEEKELKRQIKQLEAKRELTEQEVAEKLTAKKERVKKQIEELAERIQNKDFSKKTKKKEIIDTELSKLKAKRDKLTDKVKEEVFRKELDNRPKAQKRKAFIYEILTGTTRGLVAGLDASAAFVQGGRRIFTHPIEAKDAFIKGFSDLASIQKSEDFIDNLKQQEWYPMLKESGLRIMESSVKQKVQEEQAGNRILSIVWDNIIGMPFAAGNKIINGSYKTPQWLKNANPYLAAQRFYNGYVNHIRIAAFLQGIENLESNGYTMETDSDRLKALGEFVNVQTGGASLGFAEKYNEGLGVIFFSARNQVSAIKALNPFYYGFMPSGVRQQAIIEMSKSLGAIVALSMLAQAFAGDEEEDYGGVFDKDSEFWAFNSSNFMTVRVPDENGGFVALHMLGPIKSLANVLSRVYTGKVRTGSTGVEEYLGERYGRPLNSKADAVSAYVRGKFAPSIGILWQILDQKKGQEIDWNDFAFEHTLPMWSHDLNEIRKNNPAALGMLINSLNYLGMSSHYYKLTEEQREKRAEKEAISKDKYYEHLEYLDDLKYGIE